MIQIKRVDTFYVSKGYRIAAVIIGAIYIPFGLFMIWKPFDGQFPVELGRVAVLGSLGILFFLGALYLLISAFKYRFEIWNDVVRSVGIFRTTEMRIADMDGYRTVTTNKNGATIYLVAGKKRMRLMLMFDRPDELSRWLDSNLKNLSAIDLYKERKEILSDERLGATEEERQKKLNWAQKLRGITVVLVFAIYYWGIFAPRPYSLCIWVLVLMPYLGVGLVGFFPSLFKFDVIKKSQFIPVSVIVVTPAPILAMRALFDWRVLDWTPFWFSFAGFTLILFLALLAFAPDVKFWALKSIFTLIFCAVYGYGASLTLNGILDKNQPMVYPAKIMDKRMVKGRPPEFYMTLSPQNGGFEQKEYQVFGNVYQLKEVGDRVSFVIKPGAFYIPNYFVY